MKIEYAVGCTQVRNVRNQIYSKGLIAIVGSSIDAKVSSPSAVRVLDVSWGAFLLSRVVLEDRHVRDVGQNRAVMRGAGNTYISICAIVPNISTALLDLTHGLFRNP